MPHRPMSREQVDSAAEFEELLPADHPARFVGEFARCIG